MKYISTRDCSIQVDSAQAIAQGISKDGGLFVPQTIPQFTSQELQSMLSMNYQQRACVVLGKYLTDFSEQEIAESVQAAYSTGFDSSDVVPIVEISPKEQIMELWHGPSCAFKDVALQLLPQLLTRAVQKTQGASKSAILVATSGDTGKGALEGFAGVENTEIIVFYPAGGVSRVQYLQMATQVGDNVGVYAIEGNFDDTQTAVKKIFTDPVLNQLLAEDDIQFSSANSINWGRLVPQIVYYTHAYLELVNKGTITMGEKVNVCVPTGNFGNILAAYYAKQMGVPLGRFICASNQNNVLSDFIQTGRYDRHRDFVMTTSPSMDIVISSNLERLLFLLSGQNDTLVRQWMSELGDQGYYQVTPEVFEKLQQEFFGSFCDEENTQQTVARVYQAQNYLCDTHTAVALDVYRQYREFSLDETKTLVACTASPYKFSDSILGALNPNARPVDEFDCIHQLEELTGVPVPKQILELKGQPIRFSKEYPQEEMAQLVKTQLGIKE